MMIQFVSINSLMKRMIMPRMAVTTAASASRMILRPSLHRAVESVETDFTSMCVYKLRYVGESRLPSSHLRARLMQSGVRDELSQSTRTSRGCSMRAM